MNFDNENIRMTYFCDCDIVAKAPMIYSYGENLFLPIPLYVYVGYKKADNKGKFIVSVSARRGVSSVVDKFDGKEFFGWSFEDIFEKRFASGNKEVDDKYVDMLKEYFDKSRKWTKKVWLDINRYDLDYTPAFVLAQMLLACLDIEGINRNEFSELRNKLFESVKKDGEEKESAPFFECEIETGKFFQNILLLSQVIAPEINPAIFIASILGNHSDSKLLIASHTAENLDSTKAKPVTKIEIGAHSEDASDIVFGYVKIEEDDKRNNFISNITNDDMFLKNNKFGDKYLATLEKDFATFIMPHELAYRAETNIDWWEGYVNYSSREAGWKTEGIRILELHESQKEQKPLFQADQANAKFIFGHKQVRKDNKPLRVSHNTRLLEMLVVNKQIHFLSYLKIYPSWETPTQRNLETIVTRLNAFLKESNCDAKVTITGGICTIHNEENIKSNIQESLTKTECALKEEDLQKQINLLIEAVTLYNKNFKALRILLQKLQRPKGHVLEPELAKDLITSLKATIKDIKKAKVKLSKLEPDPKQEDEKTLLEDDLQADQESFEKLLTILTKYINTNRIAMPIDKEYEQLKKIILAKDGKSILNNVYIKKRLATIAYRVQRKFVILRKIKIKDIYNQVAGCLIEILPEIENIDFDEVDTVSGIINKIGSLVFSKIEKNFPAEEAGGDTESLKRYRKFYTKKEKLRKEYISDGMNDDEADKEAEEKIKEEYSPEEYYQLQNLRHFYEPSKKVSYIDEMTDDAMRDAKKAQEELIEKIDPEIENPS